MPNKNETFKKLISLVFGVMIISLALSFWVMAWTEPNQPPTDGNVAAPINVSDIGQTKSGWLSTLGGLLVGFQPDSKEPDPPAGVLQILNGALINTNGAPTGLIVAEGKVGIGTQTPEDGFRMEVSGDIKLSDDPLIPGNQDFTITNIRSPINDSDVATKAYVDSQGGEACRMRLKFAGYTSAYSGNLGGPKGAHDKCASAFSGYNNAINHVHWCSIDELDDLGLSYTYQYSVWVRDALVNLVWMPAQAKAYTFYKRYVAAYDEDNGTCQAWLSTASGNVGPVLLTTGAMAVSACSNTRRLACCYFGE